MPKRYGEMRWRSRLFFYAARDDKDQALSWLEQRAYRQRDDGLEVPGIEPRFNNLRHDPRYTQLMRKVHIPLN